MNNQAGDSNINTEGQNYLSYFLNHVRRTREELAKFLHPWISNDRYLATKKPFEEEGNVTENSGGAAGNRINRITEASRISHLIGKRGGKKGCVA